MSEIEQRDAEIAALKARVEAVTADFSTETTRANGNWLEVEALRAENWNLKERIAELEKFDQDWKDYVNTIRLNIPAEFTKQPQLDLCMQRMKECIAEQRQRITELESGGREEWRAASWTYTTNNWYRKRASAEAEAKRLHERGHFQVRIESHRVIETPVVKTPWKEVEDGNV